VPALLAAKLDKLDVLLQAVQNKGNTLAQSYVDQILKQYLLQAQNLAKQYDAVIANPPYMGGKGMNPLIKEFARNSYPAGKPDMFAMFMERCLSFGNNTSELGFVTPYVWMFISSYEEIREKMRQFKLWCNWNTTHLSQPVYLFVLLYWGKRILLNILVVI
jgi:type I restriction-modification system DNA methylase subunit